VFEEFKKFYTELSSAVPDVTAIPDGTSKFRRNGHLHRARVACATGDIPGFRNICSELIKYWYSYWACETRRKHNIDAIISRMLGIGSNPQGSSQPSSLGVGP